MVVRIVMWGQIRIMGSSPHSNKERFIISMVHNGAGEGDIYVDGVSYVVR